MTEMSRLLISLTPKQLAAVRALSSQSGASMAEVIRRMIDAALKGRGNGR